MFAKFLPLKSALSVSEHILFLNVLKVKLVEFLCLEVSKVNLALLVMTISLCLDAPD